MGDGKKNGEKQETTKIKSVDKMDAAQVKRYSLSRYIIFSAILFVIILGAGSATFLSSMRQIIMINKGNELTKLLRLEISKLETSLDREISDIRAMANSMHIRRYFLNPQNETFRERAENVINTYRLATAGSIFWINDIDKYLHFEDRAPYSLDPLSPHSAWYSQTLSAQQDYDVSVNFNPDLNETRLWINAPVINRRNEQAIGVLGSGIDISQIIARIHSAYSDISFYFFNSDMEIVGAKDVNLIAERKSVRDALGAAASEIIDTAKTLLPGEMRTFATSAGQAAVISAPMLDSMLVWYAVAVLPDSLDDFRTPMTYLFLSGILIIAFLLVLSNVFVAQLLKPLQEMMVSLQAASKAKSSFLATMSHEIRTPMNAIIGISQIELQKQELSQESASAFGKIYDSGSNLLGIINDILDMSKIETGKLELNPVPYDVPSLINDTVQLNMVRVGSKPIEFSLEIDENIPQRLVGDDLRIKQILNNLLSNAIKYTSSGSVKLRVERTLTQNGDFFLNISVSDTGQGLKIEDQKKLFSEYTRFNASANRTTEGTGIGLNITKNLVGMMDGNISVKSEYGKGSTFIVSIKQEETDDKTPIGKQLAEQLRTFKFSGKKQYSNLQITCELMPYGKVLVVDDVEANLYVANGLMSPYKLDIETATSGFETLDKVKAGKVWDIIFMDHMMPEMDGIETTQKLRELGYTGTIVALTANAIVGNEEMFKQNGFDGFVSKPIDVRHLNKVLNKFVRDKYPDEARKYKSVEGAQIPAENTANVSEKLLEIVRKDAQKAIENLRKTMENGDLKLFTTTAHAMKAALANVGEKEMSAAALALEEAGRDGDKDFISKNCPKFIASLSDLAEKLSPKKEDEKSETAASANAREPQDSAYLKEQVLLIKDACENYDDTAAYAALDLLKNKNFKKETAAALEEIRDTLFLHSDFDGAAQIAQNILQKEE